MKQWVFVGLLVLFLPVVGFADHASTLQAVHIEEVSVLGCGNSTTVVFSGSTVYGNGTTCTRLFDKPESQGFFLSAGYTNCNSPATWSYAKAYNPGSYVIKALVTTANFFNVREDLMTFTVPECEPPPTCP